MWLYVINGYSFDEVVNDVYLVVIYLFVMVMMLNAHDGYDMHKDHGVMIWCIWTCGPFIIWCHDISLMFMCWCCNFWGYYDVKNVVIACIFYDMQEHAILYQLFNIQNVVIKNDVMLSWWNEIVGMLIIFYDTMIITNASVTCWDVVIDRKFTNASRGPVYLMISWEPIHARENI